MLTQTANQKLTVKFLTPKDLDRLDLNQVNHLIHQLAGFKVDHTKDSLRKFLSQPCLYQAGAFVDQKLVGLASLFVIEKIEYTTGAIEGVVVDENYRRQGVGQAMMQALINQAKELELVHLDLTSNPTRVAANRFYQKLGFKKRETNVYRLKLN